MSGYLRLSSSIVSFRGDSIALPFDAVKEVPLQLSRAAAGEKFSASPLTRGGGIWYNTTR